MVSWTGVLTGLLLIATTECASPLVIEEERRTYVNEKNSIGLFCTSSSSSDRWLWEREDGKPFSTADSETKSVKHFVWALSFNDVSVEHSGYYLCHLNKTSPAVYRRIKLVVREQETTTKPLVADMSNVHDGECSHPQGKEGEFRTEGCLRKTCKAGVWKPSMEKTVCCFNNKAFQPSSTISTSSSPDGCSITSIDCVLDRDTAKTKLKVDNKCKGRSKANTFDEIEELLKKYIETKDHCRKKKVSDTAEDEPDLLHLCTWTPWLDRDNTTQKWGDTGDIELFGEEDTLDGFSGCNFQNEIRMRVVGQTKVFKTEAEVLAGTGDVVHVTSNGMYCKWTTGEQPDGKCEDYEVKFCCN